LLSAGWETNSRSAAAFVWLPSPTPDAASEHYAALIVAQEPLLVAMPTEHPLTARTELQLADILDQPFLALPEQAGSLRDYWLLTALRTTPTRVCATVHSAEETYEALTDGIGIVLLAAGNAPLLDRAGIALRPLVDGPISTLALLWRRNDHRPVVTGCVQACRNAIRSPS
jgi:hypothetical protein